MTEHTTDRRLLELAAKAAGVEGAYYMDEPITEDDCFSEGIFFTDENDVEQTWNPLDDDGDALRLAVKLNISIHPETGSPCRDRTYTCMGSEIEQCELHGDDPSAATRRAIVRAAAKIGSGAQ